MQQFRPGTDESRHPVPAAQVIGVVGGGSCDDEIACMAHETGRLIAGNGAVLVCGGLGGVMEAASRGARENGGVVVGILPGADRHQGNCWLTCAIPTGMGVTRNSLVVHSSDVIIAFPGSYGTLNEMALALNLGKSVIAMPGAWELRKLGEVESSLFKEANSPAHALGLALTCARYPAANAPVQG